MTTLYRSLFSCTPLDSEEHLYHTRNLFMTWATGITPNENPTDGTTQVTFTRNRHFNQEALTYDVERTVSLRTLNHDGSVIGFQGTTRETDQGKTWTTLVRVVADNGKVHTWVENQVESGQVVGLRFSVARPRIVQDLLEATPRPHFGSSGLLLAPEAIPPQLVTGLVEHLRLEGRELPMIVVSQAPTDDGGTWLSRATRIANRVMGVANVVTLNQEATARFREILERLATDDADSIAIAIIQAEDYLSDWLVIHETPQELNGINTAPQTTSWGNSAWRGFRSLAAFAEARSTGYQGSFFN